MVKQMIHAYIDPDIYLQLKSQDINISKTVNDCLSAYIGASEHDYDIEILETEITALQKQISMASSELSKKAVQLSSTQDKKIREQKEWVHKAKQMLETANANNPMRNT